MKLATIYFTKAPSLDPRVVQAIINRALTQASELPLAALEVEQSLQAALLAELLWSLAWRTGSVPEGLIAAMFAILKSYSNSYTNNTPTFISLNLVARLAHITATKEHYQRLAASDQRWFKQLLNQLLQDSSYDKNLRLLVVLSALKLPNELSLTIPNPTVLETWLHDQTLALNNRVPLAYQMLYHRMPVSQESLELFQRWLWNPALEPETRVLLTTALLAQQLPLGAGGAHLAQIWLQDSKIALNLRVTLATLLVASSIPLAPNVLALLQQFLQAPNLAQSEILGLAYNMLRHDLPLGPISTTQTLVNRWLRDLQIPVAIKATLLEKLLAQQGSFAPHEQQLAQELFKSAQVPLAAKIGLTVAMLRNQSHLGPEFIDRLQKLIDETSPIPTLQAQLVSAMLAQNLPLGASNYNLQSLLRNPAIPPTAQAEILTYLPLSERSIADNQALALRLLQNYAVAAHQQLELADRCINFPKMAPNDLVTNPNVAPNLRAYMVTKVTKATAQNLGSELLQGWLQDPRVTNQTQILLATMMLDYQIPLGAGMLEIPRLLRDTTTPVDTRARLAIAAIEANPKLLGLQAEELLQGLVQDARLSKVVKRKLLAMMPSRGLGEVKHP